MKTNLRLKNLFLSLAIGTLTVATVASCKDDDDNPVPPTNTITDQVVAGANFSLLEKAVVKAGLASTLSGTGPFTVFAPDDAAFAASGITAAYIDDAATTPAALRRILLYHTIGSKILAAIVPAGPNAVVATANDPSENVFVTKNSSGVFVNGIKVVTADVPADNGVIHVLSKVLIPAAGNIVETAVASTGGDNGLDSLVVAVTTAGLGATLSGSTVLTVFAPTNKAFRDLLTALGLSEIKDIPVDLLTKVLTYHVVAGRAFSSDLANGDLGMFGGVNATNNKTTINLTDGTGGGPTITGSKAGAAKSNIIATNIVCTNGVVHVIDNVLLQ